MRHSLIIAEDRVSGARVRIVHADPLSDEATALLRQAFQEACDLYPETLSATSQRPTNSPLPARGLYVLAYLGERLAGSGALYPLDESSAELRRMFVLPAARRQGVARAVLSYLTKMAAGELGFSVIKLETGFRQTAAIALYEGFGFTAIPRFGVHIDDPTSTCFARRATLISN